jgi:hypothetical protein
MADKDQLRILIQWVEAWGAGGWSTQRQGFCCQTALVPRSAGPLAQEVAT